MTDIVVRKPDIQGGEPCIAGTRVTVDAIQSWAASGFDNERIKQEYPGLTDDQIDAARAYKMPPVTDIDLDKLKAPTDAQIDHAIRQTEYKYFGDYEFSEEQHLAVETLVRAASALSAARTSAREAAAEIERLRSEVEAGQAVARAINRVLSPQADRTFDLLISETQWAVDTCRAYLARSERQ